MGATSGHPRVLSILRAAVIAAAVATGAAPAPAAGSAAPAPATAGPTPTAPLIWLSGRGTATVDGTWNAGEWDRAGRYDFRVAMPTSDGGGTAPATILVMNDDDTIYLAAWIGTVTGCSFNPTFSFDTDADGSPFDLHSDHVGGHVTRWTEGNLPLFDGFTFPEGNLDFDTNVHVGYPPAGTIDGVGYGSHPDGVATFGEYAHPLDSDDDVHDISARVGMHMRMVANLSLQGGPCGTCDAPGCFASTMAPALGQFIVQFVPADDTPPLITLSPQVGGDAPSTLGEGSTRIWWAGEDADGDSMIQYRVERRVDGGAWRLVTTSGENELRVALRFGHRYRYRVTPRDAAGNWGSTVSGHAFTPVLVQDRSARVQYGGRWARRNVDAASGGTIHTTSRKGARATIQFTGYAISWVTATGPGRGRVAVYVDGVRRHVIDLRAGRVHWRRISVVKSFPDGGSHTLEVRNLDGSRLDMDAFVVYR